VDRTDRGGLRAEIVAVDEVTGGGSVDTKKMLKSGKLMEIGNSKVCLPQSLSCLGFKYKVGIYSNH
jgi:hypothetical protein